MTEPSTPRKWIVAGVVLGAVVVASLAVLAVVVLGGGDDGTRAVGSTSTSTSAPDAPRTSGEVTVPGGEGDPVVDEQTVTLQVGSVERRVLVVAPPDLREGESVPAVVVLHGLGVNANAMSRQGGWRDAVARDRFVAVFPQGTNDSWNLGPCCPPANLLGVADVAFLDAVVAWTSSQPEVDADRMYFSGFSNGALMVYAYTCDHPATFAAVAPMAGTNVTGCTPSQPVSLLHQHGDADLVVPYRGGVGLGSLVSSAPFPTVEGSVAAWAAADGCGATPEELQEGTVVRTEWSGCAEGTRVELITVTGKGHDWLRTRDHDPLEVMLEFFGIG